MVLYGLLVLLAIGIIIGLVMCIVYGIKHMISRSKCEKGSKEAKKHLKIAIIEFSVVATFLIIVAVLIILFATGLIVIRLM